MVISLKNLIIGSFLSILILIALLGYRQNIFTSTILPYDDEQTGLDNQIVIKFSHVVAENTPKGIAAEKFKNLVETKSDGRIIVQIYPNAMLYNDHNELQALKDGEIQMIAPTFSKMTDYLPNWQVLDLPFVIENEEQLERVLTGPLSDKLLDELDSINIKGLTFWSNGFKQMASSDSPIIETEDFLDKKIRIMPSNILEEQFNLLKANPVEASFDDVFNELENQQINAQENTISNIYSKNFYEMENHITLSNHGILSYAVMMNHEFWDQLNTEDQTILLDALEEMKIWQFEQAVEINNNNLQALLREEAVSIYKLNKVSRNKWKKELFPIYDYFKKNVHPTYLDELIQEINN